ncbi:hypothetical protein CKM354_000755600 [Cercospora kikuchii]|uniref:DUF3752 domain-containing protein n=1 Tax=Cercospora kikuchii TaxID=84275 RepID=A0A9P3FEF0_9PEZI|nr:uncharacterized protein CKM354_000755600 [Cercospora kikuchii]GIZ44356.1 hypothetical protein CKM354_000755600 [Cercospora kikuchii]
MSDMTPDLPPHLLAKRKRQQEGEAEGQAATTSGAKRAASPEEPEKRRKIGPALPPAQEEPDTQDATPRRVVGPAPPPAPLDERPPGPPPNQQAEDSSDDSDDGYGPALPNAVDPKPSTSLSQDPSHGDHNDELTSSKPKRDDWMMMPPKQDDLAARLDPLKARPTKFAGKGAHKGETDSSTWHETPEQKQKRLQDEMMGISSSSNTNKTTSAASNKTSAAQSAKARKDEEAHRIVNEKRGPSLLEQHSQKSKANGSSEKLEDDPSKRAFDREKDIGGGVISATQRREMLNKAQGFAGKFSGGSYL